MNHRTRIACAVAGVVAAAVFATPVWAGSGTDNLMHLTMRITQHIPGEPAIPPHTLQHTLCTKANGKFDPAELARTRRANNQCKTTHYQKLGHTITVDQMCTAGGGTVTSHSVFQQGPGVDFTGTTQTSVVFAGRNMTVNVDYVGKKVGSCTYHPPKTSG